MQESISDRPNDHLFVRFLCSSPHVYCTVGALDSSGRTCIEDGLDLDNLEEDRFLQVCWLVIARFGISPIFSKEYLEKSRL